MPKRLPVSLRDEPIAEAVCEVRVGGTVPLHNTVPGLLMSAQAGAVSEIATLPAASVPEAIRAADPDFASVPLTKFRWNDLTILVGSRVVTISHVPPYLGWAEFKRRILGLFNIILRPELTPTVERYSLKYQNVFRSPQVPDKNSILDINFRLGQLNFKPGGFFLRAEVVDIDLITIVQAADGATLQIPGQPVVQGLLLDVDTIFSQSLSCDEFLTQMEGRLDRTRLVNKTVFFECLQDQLIENLGPTYAD